MITAADIAEIVKDLRTRSESCEKLAALGLAHQRKKAYLR